MGFVRLCVLSGTMFISTLVIGNLPLSLSSSLSQLRIRQISLYGVGLLVGASLTIIIPEGVDAVYESSGYEVEDGKGRHAHEVKSGLVGVALISGFLLMFLIDQLQASQTGEREARPSSRSWGSRVLGSSRRHPSVSSSRPLLARGSSSVAKRPSASNLRASASSPSPALPLNGSPAAASSSNPNVSVTIDDEEACEHPYGGVNAGRGYRPHEDDDHDSQAEDYFPASPLHHRTRPASPFHRHRSSVSEKQTSQGLGRSWSTSIGLIAHSFADGVSLGASSAALPSAAESGATATASGSTSLDLVVFLAIMVHKAPAAFGLVAVLMSGGLTRTRIRQVLLAFSAAAPLGALATWGLLQLLMGRGSDNEEKKLQNVEWWTGMALLFSGGTFLFVATHVMQEGDPLGDASSHGSSPASSETSLSSNRGAGEHISLSSASVSAGEGKDRSLRATSAAGSDEGQEVGRWTKTILMVGGMLSPMVLTRIVGHGH